MASKRTPTRRARTTRTKTTKSKRSTAKRSTKGKPTVRLTAAAKLGVRGNFVSLVEQIRNAARKAGWTPDRVAKLHAAMIHCGGRSKAIAIASRYFALVGAE